MIDSGAVSVLGLGFEPSLVRRWSVLELSRAFPSSSGTGSSRHGKLARIRAFRQRKQSLDRKIENLEKEYWSKSKKFIDVLYFTAMDEFRRVLHLFLAELISLNVLYQTRVMTPVEFKQSYERLCRVYFESHLSGELSKAIIETFLEYLYPNNDSTELGINLARGFRG